MSEDIIAALKENVIQGRKTSDDEGIDNNLTGPGVLELTQQAIDANLPPKAIITDGLTSGMEIVGQKFASKEYFIPDMLASAKAVGAVMEILEPYLVKSDIKPKGKVLMVTVKGDFHDIGKNIVSILLRGTGYIVKDLGNDIAPQVIVDAVKEEKPQFLGLSALLTSTMLRMEDTIQALINDGVRDKVKVIIGGVATSEEFADSIGADGYGADGFQAVKVVDALNSNKEDLKSL